MNGKAAKRLRKALREQGVDPAKGEAIGIDVKPVIAVNAASGEQRVVGHKRRRSLRTSSGRAQYRKLKGAVQGKVVGGDAIQQKHNRDRANALKARREEHLNRPKLSARAALMQAVGREMS